MSIFDFFAPSGKFPPAGTFSMEHIFLSSISVLFILLALWITRKSTTQKILTIIRILSISLCVLEAIKIIFTLSTSSIKDINSYIPLYFCSITLPAGLLAGFARGWWRRTGEVFLATGGLVGGVIYIIYPLTSITIYPPIHFITIYSFILHAAMVYLGLLVLTTGHIRLRHQDIDRFFLIVSLVSVLAFAINITLHTNLMFLSQNYPGTLIEIAYNLFPGLLFPLFMYLFQAFAPFYAVYIVYWAATRRNKSQ